MNNWKENVNFVLVEPREPGNIGSAARAMKNMGFKKLSLVNPPVEKTEEAAWFARNAQDVLESAVIYSSMKDALKDVRYVVGTSRRRGRRRGVFVPVEKGAQRISDIARTNKVAVLFGREDRGLYNDEVEACGFLMTIPASREHPSLNLAHAVMIIAYELTKVGLKKDISSTKDNDTLLTADPPRMVNQAELSHLYERMESVFKMIGYIPPDDSFLNRKIMQNLKHCLGRTGLSIWELNMFHGMCKHIERTFGSMD